MPQFFIHSDACTNASNTPCLLTLSLIFEAALISFVISYKVNDKL